MRRPRAARPVAPDGADKAQDPSPDPVNNESLLERERAAGLTRDLKTHVSFLRQGRFDGAWSAMADDMEEAAQAITTLLSRLEAAEAALQSAQAELTRMREADGWQPIETAPKDWTPVDLWVEFPEHAKARRVPNALWNVEEGGWQLGRFLQSQFAVTPIIKYWRPAPGRPAALQPQEEGQ